MYGKISQSIIDCKNENINFAEKKKEKNLKR